MELDKRSPEKIRENVILASLYITAFDMLEMGIKGKTKDFITIGYENDIEKCNEIYKREVTDKYLFYSKGKRYYDEYRACVMWLKDSNAIDENELDILLEIRRHRNDVVHKLPKLILDESLNLNISLFQSLQKLFKKIMFFLGRIEIIVIYDDFLDKDIKDNEIEPLNVQFLDYIISTFLK
jgi:hypothetical protein